MMRDRHIRFRSDRKRKRKSDDEDYDFEAEIKKRKATVKKEKQHGSITMLRSLLRRCNFYANSLLSLINEQQKVKRNNAECASQVRKEKLQKVKKKIKKNYGKKCIQIPAPYKVFLQSEDNQLFFGEKLCFRSATLVSRLVRKANALSKNFVPQLLSVSCLIESFRPNIDKILSWDRKKSKLENIFLHNELNAKENENSNTGQLQPHPLKDLSRLCVFSNDFEDVRYVIDSMLDTLEATLTVESEIQDIMYQILDVVNKNDVIVDVFVGAVENDIVEAGPDGYQVMDGIFNTIGNHNAIVDSDVRYVMSKILGSVVKSIMTTGTNEHCAVNQIVENDIVIACSDGHHVMDQSVDTTENNEVIVDFDVQCITGLSENRTVKAGTNERCAVTQTVDMIDKDIVTLNSEVKHIMDKIMCTVENCRLADYSAVQNVTDHVVDTVKMNIVNMDSDVKCIMDAIIHTVEDYIVTVGSDVQHFINQDVTAAVKHTDNIDHWSDAKYILHQIVDTVLKYERITKSDVQYITDSMAGTIEKDITAVGSGVVKYKDFILEDSVNMISDMTVQSDMRYIVELILRRIDEVIDSLCIPESSYTHPLLKISRRETPCCDVTPLSHGSAIWERSDFLKCRRNIDVIDVRSAEKSTSSDSKDESPLYCNFQTDIDKNLCKEIMDYMVSEVCRQYAFVTPEHAHNSEITKTVEDGLLTSNSYSCASVPCSVLHISESTQSKTFKPSPISCLQDNGAHNGSTSNSYFCESEPSSVLTISESTQSQTSNPSAASFLVDNSSHNEEENSPSLIDGPSSCKVPCPICGKRLKESRMNKHLDNCVLGGEKRVALRRKSDRPPTKRRKNAKKMKSVKSKFSKGVPTSTKSDRNTGKAKSCETVVLDRQDCETTKGNVKPESRSGSPLNVYDTGMECSSRTDLTILTESDRNTSNMKSYETVVSDLSTEWNDCDTTKGDMKIEGTTGNTLSVCDTFNECSSRTDLATVTESDQNTSNVMSDETALPNFCAESNDCDTTENNVKPESSADGLGNVCDTFTEYSSKTDLSTETECDQHFSYTTSSETVLPDSCMEMKDFYIVKDMKPESPAGNLWNVYNAFMECSSRTELSTWTESDPSTSNMKFCETVMPDLSTERNNCDTNKNNVKPGSLWNVYNTFMECLSRTGLSTMTESDSNVKSCGKVVPHFFVEGNDCDTGKDDVKSENPTDILCNVYGASMEFSSGTVLSTVTEPDQSTRNSKSCETVVPDYFEYKRDYNATNDKSESSAGNPTSIYYTSVECSSRTGLFTFIESDQNTSNMKSYATDFPDSNTERNNCYTSEDHVKIESPSDNLQIIFDTSMECSSMANLSSSTESDQITSKVKSCKTFVLDSSAETNDCDTTNNNIINRESLSTNPLNDTSVECSSRADLSQCDREYAGDSSSESENEEIQPTSELRRSTRLSGRKRSFKEDSDDDTDEDSEEDSEEDEEPVQKLEKKSIKKEESSCNKTNTIIVAPDSELQTYTVVNIPKRSERQFLVTLENVWCYFEVAGVGENKGILTSSDCHKYVFHRLQTLLQAMVLSNSEFYLNRSVMVRYVIWCSIYQGDIVRVKWGRDESTKLYKARVLNRCPTEEGDYNYLVHYIGWSDMYDDWIFSSDIHSGV